MRETLFNWLGQDLTGKRCLDLFAGSGALGMEAASRGASAVVMVENNRAVYSALQENIGKLDFHNIALRSEDGLKFVLRSIEQFDVIFLDPPFESDYLEKLLPHLTSRLAREGMLYIESGKPFEAVAPWQLLKSGKAGAVYYQLWQLEQHD